MRHVLRIAVLLIGCIGLGAGARADEKRDCQRNNPEVRITACSRLISKGGVGNEELARFHGLRAVGLMSRSMRDGERDKILADLDEAIRLDPASAQTHYYHGLRHNALQNTDAALAEFDSGVRLDPASARLVSARGSAYARKGQLDTAIPDFETAMRLDPSFAQGPYNRGLAFVRKSEFDRAIADFDAAIKIDPSYLAAYFERGGALREKREYDRSIADFDFVIRQDPARVAAYVGRGRSYGDKGDLDRAFADYNIAVRIDPLHAHAFNNRGNIHRSRKEYDRARDDYDTAIRLDPKYVIAYSNRSAVMKDLGDVGAAIADLKKVLEIPAVTAADKQRHVTARERIGRLEKELGGKAAPSSEPGKHKRVALVIGNGKYAHVSELANPPNDAKGMAAALRRVGFTSVTEIVDGTRDTMQKALKNFGDLAEGAEWAVVFFAGHGIEINGTSYLVPIDAGLKRDTHAEDEAIALSRVMAKVDAASKLGLIILDSCRNNPFAARMVRSAGATRSAIGSGLAPVEPEGNVVVFYAAKHGSVAEDGTGANSPFTEALLVNLEQPGLEVRHLLGRVRDMVRRKTERRQDPFHYGSLGEEMLYFRAGR